MGKGRGSSPRPSSPHSPRDQALGPPPSMRLIPLKGECSCLQCPRETRLQEKSQPGTSQTSVVFPSPDPVANTESVIKDENQKQLKRPPPPQRQPLLLPLHITLLTSQASSSCRPLPRSQRQVWSQHLGHALVRQPRQQPPRLQPCPSKIVYASVFNSPFYHLSDPVNFPA